MILIFRDFFPLPLKVDYEVEAISSDLGVAVRTPLPLKVFLVTCSANANLLPIIPGQWVYFSCYV